jgi:hypothetical protein
MTEVKQPAGNDLEKDLHEYAVSQSRLHGKRILRADSDKDTTFVFIGGGVGCVVALFACRLLDIHSQILSLVVVAIGFVIGLAVGYSLFSRLFVKDESSQPPVFDSSWEEYRREASRWMGRSR